MPTDILNQGGFPAQARSLVLRFLIWYFRDHPVVIVRDWLLYAGAFRESFSILFLLKTLLSPWKSIKTSYPQKGFNWQAILEAFFVNVTTRGIGAVIRISAIIAGLLIQICLLVGFAAYLLIWIAFPIIVVFIPLYMILAFFL